MAKSLVLCVATPTPTATLPAATPTPTLTPGPSSYVSPEQRQRLLWANTEFGFNLFQELLQEDAGKNIFISPLSVSLALAMTYNGAAGETQQAIAKVLRLEGMHLGEVNQASAALLKSLQGLNPEVELNIASSLWADQGFPFKPDFLERNREYFAPR